MEDEKGYDGKEESINYLGLNVKRNVENLCEKNYKILLTFVEVYSNE